MVYVQNLCFRQSNLVNDGTKTFYKITLWKSYFASDSQGRNEKEGASRAKYFLLSFSLSFLSAEKQHWMEEADQLHLKNIYSVVINVRLPSKPITSSAP